MSPAALANFVLQGSPHPLPDRIPLRAGPLTLFFEQGDLRTVRLGRTEIIRRIYGAVRDPEWGTVPGVLQDLEIHREEAGFLIRFTQLHQAGPIDFVWQGEIVGEPDGSLRFTFDGEARSTFLRNRIGLCVLHPIRACVGARCRVGYAEGGTAELRFPEVIAAEQPIDGFHDLVSLAHQIEPGWWAEWSFTGDRFETEDQRNWIDASFKTFGTPLHLPRPVEVRAGTRVRQEVRLRLKGPAEDRPNRASASLVETELLVELAPDQPARRLPEFGLGQASHGNRLSEREGQLLRLLRPAHLRVDLRASDPSAWDRLAVAQQDAAGVNAALELALHLDTGNAPGSTEKFLAALVRSLESARVQRVLVFGARSDKSTPAGALTAARKGLARLRLPLGAGTDGDLYQFNLQRPPPGADFVCWAMNPQVHAFDCGSIAETPEAAGHQLRSVAQYFPGLPLVVSPITLKPRFNSTATGLDSAAPPGLLPPPVDPRQLSLFAATWTLGILKALAENGATSGTLLETTGGRGVLETAIGSRLPELFPSQPGQAFPVFHILADVGEFAGGESLATTGGEGVTALFLQSGGRRRLILANPGATPLTIRLVGFRGLDWLRRLDATTATAAAAGPLGFRGIQRPTSGDSIHLPSFGVATLDDRAVRP